MVLYNFIVITATVFTLIILFSVFQLSNKSGLREITFPLARLVGPSIGLLGNTRTYYAHECID